MRTRRSSPMRACLAAGLFAHSVVAQFGTIHIDWVSEGALGDGRATPHIGGLSAGSEDEEPAAPSADTYEEAWWRDDFAHDPPSVWFGAATTQRGKRPASMASARSTRPPWRQAPAQPADWPRLAGAWGRHGHDLTLTHACREPACRSLCHLLDPRSNTHCVWAPCTITRSRGRVAWSLAGTSAPARHASGSPQTSRASAPGLTRCAGCAPHRPYRPSPRRTVRIAPALAPASVSPQPSPQRLYRPSPRPSHGRSCSRSPLPGLAPRAGTRRTTLCSRRSTSQMGASTL